MSRLAEIVLDFIVKNLKTKTPLIVGLNGVQGSGKTTVCASVKKLLEDSNNGGRQAKTCVCLSMDDFFFSYAEQCSLFQKTKNSLLEFRGLPGTHDLSLLTSVLRSLACGKPTLIPRYDKSLNAGRGDRLPIADWTKQEKPADVILVEGWSMGFRSISVSLDDKNGNPFPNITKQHLVDWNCTMGDLLEVNDNLRLYEKEWYPLIDIFIQIKPLDVKYVYEWRWQQEETMRKIKGRPDIGLSRDQIVDFVNRFMPAYFIYLDNLSNGGFFSSSRSANGRFLQVILDLTRSVQSSTVL